MPSWYVDLVAGTGLIMRSNLWKTIDEELHTHTPELAEILVNMVQEKTPIRTGALLSDVTGQAYTDPGAYVMGSEDLVWVYAGNTMQEAFWNRVYAPYQEGGPLGLPTYTNDPRQMFYDTATGDGLAAVGAWAEMYIHYAELLCTMGAGVPFP